MCIEYNHPLGVTPCNGIPSTRRCADSLLGHLKFRCLNTELLY